jgi:hypothetical protein
MKQDYSLSPGSVMLVTGGRGYTQQRMHALIVELALAGPVKLLLGGNHYDHYGVNYALAAATSQYEHILDEHIRLSRAETCYQMVELLLQTQADRAPSLVMDLLTTFHDEGVPEREVNQLLFEAISALRRLSGPAVVVVSARPGGNRPYLLKALEKAVDWVEYAPLRSPQTLRQYSLSE